MFDSFRGAVIELELSWETGAMISSYIDNCSPFLRNCCLDFKLKEKAINANVKVQL